MSEVERVVIGPRSHFHEEVERSAKELKEYKKYITVTVTKNNLNYFLFFWRITTGTNIC